MNKEFSYSFIIPHKNCPDLLQRCVDSIPEREDVQIIVIDDNSDADKKPSINRKGVEVVLLDAEHSKGAGRARNVGLGHAKGKWLLFADADDYYTDFLPILLDKYIDDNTTDIVYLNACMFDENDDIRPFNTHLINNYLNNVKGAEMRLRYGMWTPWSRMVKKSIVDTNSICFDELPAGNDIIFGLKCSRYAKVIRVESEIIYKYFKPRKGSCTDKARDKMIDTRLALICNVIKFNREVGYNSRTNLFEIIIKHLKQKDVSFWVGIKLYTKYLNLCEVSMISDICKFIVKKGRFCFRDVFGIMCTSKRV